MDSTDQSQDYDPSQGPAVAPGPTYVGPAGGDLHQVLTGDGQLLTVPSAAIPPNLVNDAVQAKAAQPVGAWDAFKQTFGGTAAEGMGINHGQDPTDAVAQGEAERNPAPAPEQAPQPEPQAVAAPAPLPMAPSTDAVLGSAPKTGGGGGPGVNNAVFTKEQQDLTTAAQAKMQADTDAAKQNLATGQATAAQQAANDQDLRLKQAANQVQQQDMLQRSQKIASDFMNARIDPNSYWNNKSTGDKLGVTAAMMLSGIGSAIQSAVTKQPVENLALKSYNDAQERDLAAQKYNIEHGKEASEMYTNLFNNYKSLGLDQRQAHEATALSIKEKNQTDMANNVAANGGEQAKAAFLNTTAPIAADIQQRKMALAKESAETFNLRATGAHTVAETAQLGVQNGSLRDVQAAQKLLSQGYGIEQLQPNQRQALINNAAQNKKILGNTGIATNREVTPDDNQREQDLQLASNLVQTIDRETKGTVWSPQAKSAAQTLQIIVPKILGSTSRVNTGAQEATSNIISGNPAGPFSHWGRQSAALKAELGQVRNSLHENLGLVPFKKDRTAEQAAAFGAKKAQ